MKPGCTCDKRSGDCPAPHDCGIYFLQGQEDTYDRAPLRISLRERVTYAVLMTLGIAVWFITLALFIKNCLLK